MSVVWIIAYNAVIKGCEKYHKEVVTDDSVTIEGAEPKQKVKLAPIMISCGMITILLGIILQGCLRDGITDWIPNLISSAGNESHIPKHASPLVQHSGNLSGHVRVH